MPGTKGSGRRPTPTSLKNLRGNPGKRKLNDAEPVLETKAPAKPTLSPEADAYWNGLLPLLLDMRVVSEADAIALAACCKLCVRLDQAEAEISGRGLIVDEPIVDKDGNEVGTRTKANPAVGIADRTYARLKSYLIEFGLTPAARTKVRVDKPPQADPFDAFLSRGTPTHKVM